MWIRSQDKENLIPLNGGTIKISRNDNAIFADSLIDSDCYWKIGEYATNERAIEVQGQIEEKLAFNSTHDEIIGGKKIIGETVFEMPQE